MRMRRARCCSSRVFYTKVYQIGVLAIRPYRLHDALAARIHCYSKLVVSSKASIYIRRYENTVLGLSHENTLLGLSHENTVLGLSHENTVLGLSHENTLLGLSLQYLL